MLHYRVKEDCDIPVFANGIVKYTAEEMVTILLNKRHHEGVISQRQPLYVKESKVFLVNTDNLDHPDDVKADDLGSWKNDGQHKRWVKVKWHLDKLSSVEFCSGKPKHDPSAYCLHRSYYVHHSSHHFKRKISYLSGMYTTSTQTICSFYVLN